MAVVRRSEVASDGHRPVEVLDAVGVPVPVAGDFLAHLAARGCSPNTVLAYGTDLGHLWRFLGAARLSWDAVTPELPFDPIENLGGKRVSQRLRERRRQCFEEVAGQVILYLNGYLGALRRPHQGVSTGVLQAPNRSPGQPEGPPTFGNHRIPPQRDPLHLGNPAVRPVVDLPYFSQEVRI